MDNARATTKETLNKANERIECYATKLEESKIGKMIPTKFENLGLKQLTWMLFCISAAFFANVVGILIAVVTLLSGERKRIGVWIGLVVLAISIGHDLFAMLKKRKTLLSSFLLIKGTVVLWIIYFLFASNAGSSAEDTGAYTFFRFTAAAAAVAVNLLYGYMFSLYLSKDDSTTGGQSV